MTNYSCLLNVIKFLLLVKLVTAAHRYPLRQHNVVDDLNRFALRAVGSRYPFHHHFEDSHHKELAEAPHHRSNWTRSYYVKYEYENSTYTLRNVFKLVSMQIDPNSTNVTLSTLRDNLDNLQLLIKHSILKYMSPRLDSVSVRVDRLVSRRRSNSTIGLNQTLSLSDFPICVNITVKSPIKIVVDELENSIIQSAVNSEDCQFYKNESSIKCFLFKTKSRASVLRLGDYWVRFHQDLDLARAESQKLAEEDVFIFKYNHTWVIGLGVIGGVIGLFFIGCIIAICYTRRPYRRSGKVYEIETASKKSAKIPQVPGIHPATKATVVTKNKELYY